MLNTKQLAELEERVEVAMQDGHQRAGQAYMNCLFDMNPDLYREITGGPADCFYDNDKINAFIVYVGIDPAILEVAKRYDFDVTFTGADWYIRHEELNCYLSWSYIASNNSFWETLRFYFNEVGAERLALSL